MRFVSSFCILRSGEQVFDLILLQISGLTLVLIKFSQFCCLLYFSCFSFVFSSDKLVLTILSISKANLAFLDSLTVPSDSYSLESSPRISSSSVFEVLDCLEVLDCCRRSLTLVEISSKFPAISPWAECSTSMDSESLISSLFLLRDVLDWVITWTADVTDKIMRFIESRYCYWRSLSSFKPLMTWCWSPAPIFVHELT